MARCHTDGLQASLAPEPGSAGNGHAWVVLRNTGATPCRIYGYDGVQLVDADGRPMPTRQVRVASPRPSLVTVAPGATARSQLRWGTVPGTGDSSSHPCLPRPSRLAVIPPDETRPISVPWRLGRVCERGTLYQQTNVAG